MTNIDTLIKAKELQLLADIGFIAGSRGLHRHANVIFDAIEAMRPKQEISFLGKAIVQILAGHPEAAVEGLAKAPATPATQAFYGIGLVQLGDTRKGREILERIAKTATDTPFAKLAKEALSDLDSRVAVYANTRAIPANKANEFDPMRNMA
ncbi:hypothetical protein [Labrenzia sp. OB1]|uniref:tetratricopeptide repeat protein n=1 Tax=Labrenzia sp. OB1 TaxID=1561204 RepID=UPI0012E6F0E1|nr:hypothetical protein [Labrenzia sp. OB1]